MDFIIVGIGGFIGCCLRFGISKLMLPISLKFPLSTLLANIIAGFLVGVISQIEKDFSIISPRTKLFLTTGMLGGLSTFSAFSIETINLFSENKYFFGSLNIILNLVFSFLGVIAGIIVVKYFFKKIA